MAFDPVAYLAKGSQNTEFDPEAYLAKKMLMIQQLHLTLKHT